MGQVSTRPFAVVTGASSGIGFELAKQLQERGYDLLIVSASDAIHEAAGKLGGGGWGQAGKADLATSEVVEPLVAENRGAARPVDVCATNAGVGVGGDSRETDLRAELSMIQLNCSSAVHLAKRLVDDMTARGEGKLLFTSSV